jgi:hypothetical protein
MLIAASLGFLLLCALAFVKCARGVLSLPAEPSLMEGFGMLGALLSAAAPFGPPVLATGSWHRSLEKQFRHEAVATRAEVVETRRGHQMPMTGCDAVANVKYRFVASGMTFEECARYPNRAIWDNRPDKDIGQTLPVMFLPNQPQHSRAEGDLDAPGGSGSGYFVVGSVICLISLGFLTLFVVANLKRLVPTLFARVGVALVIIGGTAYCFYLQVFLFESRV